MNTTEIAKSFFNDAHKVYNLLEDETSKFIFEKRLMHNIVSNFSNDLRTTTKYADEIIDHTVPELKGNSINDIRKKFKEESLSKIKKLSKKNITIYGAGIAGKRVYNLYNNYIKFVCDKNSIEGFDNTLKITPEMLVTDYKNNTVVIIAIHNERDYNQVRNFLIINGFNEELIYSYQEFDYTTYITPFSLQKSIAKNQYFDKEIISFTDNEIFVDVGVYDLKTSKTLLENCKSVNKIYAFEPNPTLYSQCLEISKTISCDIELINKGLFNQNTTLHFSSKGSCSTISQTGDISIEVTTLDKVIDEKVTFIKMDIEGSELAALEGAKNTIIKYKPKLAISIYHKKEDIIDIPLYIYSLVPEYKFYIRHYSFLASEVVLYAVL